MADKPVNTFGPLLLTATLTTNVYNQGSALIYDLIRGFVFANTTAAAVTVTLYKGLTGANTAGTELFKGYSIPANTTIVFPWPGAGLKVINTDFIVGGCSTLNAITMMAIGFQLVV